jgi:type III secretion protein J
MDHMCNQRRRKSYLSGIGNLGYSTIRALMALIAIVAATFLVAGCSPHVSNLYKGLSEAEANRLVAFLDQHEIAATKSLDRDGMAVRVPSTELARAARLSARAGLPRSDFKSFGTIFPKDGLISSPVEERARLTFAISQQIESMLAEIDGVVSSRVNVVMPEKRNGRLGDMPSAAVLIRHREGLETDLLVNKVRRLVASSVPGLVDAESRQVSISFIAVLGPDQTSYNDLAPTSGDDMHEQASATPSSDPRSKGPAWWTYALGVVPALTGAGLLVRRQFQVQAPLASEVALTRL